MAKQKFYVVWVGRKPGVYVSWSDCQEQINKFDDAKFKSFETKAAAEEAYKAGWKKHWGQGSKGPSSSQPQKSSSKRSSSAATDEEIDYNSISVDVGTSGNPGPVEYKGVDTQSGEILFSVGPIRKGTNNLGEFLAIVHGLAYLKKQGSNKTLYSDSVNALKWVKQKAVSSTLVKDDSTAEIWELVDRAVRWLHTNTYDTKVVKWQTKQWGEIKADYGRK
ncbi:ribonuclease H [Paenibacillus baekrokdamisoli]|uniref:Ribonuclease H n=1 Tax=Paenibacillus baekrokdamisoli TaxID=1712516 RepID=A0A3G9JFV6_9BACL|nr:ribonuclease H family protein [Paenibacillus baekrokdamisoli]MBB3068014.1 ribonuclease HI [Paenibacillus baekrokdamisoli]BBH22938.1 ribonuclease H [Paenibacillus baekrokdamisoli]